MVIDEKYDLNSRSSDLIRQMFQLEAYYLAMQMFLEVYRWNQTQQILVFLTVRCFLGHGCALEYKHSIKLISFASERKLFSFLFFCQMIEWKQCTPVKWSSIFKMCWIEIYLEHKCSLTSSPFTISHISISHIQFF